MIPALLLLFSTAGALTLVDDTVRVPAGGAVRLPIHLAQKAGVVRCSFSVVNGEGRVRILLLGGEPRRPIASTAYVEEGGLSIPLRYPGEYLLLVDNRRPGNQAALVTLKVSIAFSGDADSFVRYIAPERRMLVMWLSFCYFVGVLWFSGRKLKQVLDSRPGRDEFH